MAQADETIAVGFPEGIKQRTRVLATGKTQTRFTIEVKGEPVMVHFSDREIGRKPAETLAEILRENLKIHAASHPVAPTTEAKRRYAAKAYDEGKRWAMKRYSGGRMGGRRPDSAAVKGWGSDSGRLAESLYPTWNPTEGHYTINTAANRLDRASFGPRFDQFLSQFVLALNLKGAADSQRFKQAQAEGMMGAIQRKRDIVEQKRAQLEEEVGRLLRING